MSETKFPLTLIGIAVVVYAGFGLSIGGPAGGIITLFILLLQALITTVLGVMACFVTAQILSTNFGTLQSASVNLAAVALFPAAAGMLMGLISPILGAIAVIVLYFGLLKSLFDLELFELIVFVLVLWGVSWVAQQVVGWIEASLS